MAQLNILHYFVPHGILCQIFSKYLNVDDVACFDRAMCNNCKRLLLLEFIRCENCSWLGHENREFKSKGISWLSDRGIKIKHLKYCDAVTDRMAAKIDTFGKNLHLLTLKAVNDKNMCKIVESCPNIKHLITNDCRNIANESIFMISQCYPNIKTLRLSCSHTITDEGIISIAKNCSNIEQICLAFFFRVTDYSVSKIRECCNKLKGPLIHNGIFL